ncbi:MAG: glycerol-3-phosphate dehydrogenase/oxidase [Actinomycetota bacterium]|nr:glycerol-3-phosphate dehydrogenase/oxidase [Actinomycetota bacterium]
MVIAALDANRLRHLMRHVTPFERDAMLTSLRNGGEVDVLVVGGGITGCGVALDAATRGLRTALVERDDFAAGTSSKSSKLVHGGLRYLQQGDIRLVYEALRERFRLRRNAPHLVQILPFMIPILTKDSVVSRKVARALGMAMWMYDLTGGFRIGKFHKRLSADEAFAHMPTTRRDRLRSAYLYFDATADDARLTLALAQTAAANGATVVNDCEVIGFGDDAGHVRVRDRITGDEIVVRARVVVNAAGVWTDEVRSLHEGAHPGTLRPAKGVHVTVPWDRVRNDIAVVIPVPGDKRTLFVVPWGRLADGTFRHCYVGTTDTDYTGPLDDPQCTAEDVDYVLRALNAALDRAITEPLTPGDVTASWAGLRPLVAAADSERTADLSRRHVVTTSADGVVRVTGGKLTTYREMADDTVDVVMKRLGRKGRSRTKSMRLVGATKLPAEGVADEGHGHLLARYGARAKDVERLVDDDPSLGRPLVDGLPYLRAEAVYAVRHEMATSLVDVVTRRTRAHLVDREATRRAARDIAELLAPVAGWDESAVTRQVDAYEALCEQEERANRTAEVLPG